MGPRTRFVELPDEVMEEIFLLANSRDTLRQVSKRISQLVSRSVHVVSVHVQNEKSILSILQSRCCGVIELSLPTMTCRMWNALSQFCPQLAKLSLRSSPVPLQDEELPLPLLSLRSLETVSSANMWLLECVPNLLALSLAKSVEGYEAFVPLMPQLEHFSVAYRDGLGDAQMLLLATMIRSGTRLIALDFNDQGFTIYPSEKELILSLQTVLPQLTSVALVTAMETSFLPFLNPNRSQLTKVHMKGTVEQFVGLNLRPGVDLRPNFFITSSKEMALTARNFTNLTSMGLVMYQVNHWVPVSSVTLPHVSRLKAELCNDSRCTWSIILASFPNLTDLDVSWGVSTDLTAKMLCFLAQCIPRALERLAMKCHRFKFTDLGRFYLPKLRQVKQLTVSLSGSASSSSLSAYLYTIPDIFPNLTHLHCERGFQTFFALDLFAQRLVELSICMNNATDVDAFSCMHSHMSLESLTLRLDHSGNHKRGTRIACGPLFEQLSSLTHLRRLYLADVAITAAPLRRLLGSPSLKELSIYENCEMTEECCDVLSKLGQDLRSLDLPEHGVSYAGLVTILDGLKGCCLDQCTASVNPNVDSGFPFDYQLARELSRKYEPICLVATAQLDSVSVEAYLSD